MTKRYDVIVLGVGAMGSAACWRLASRGARVLGLEQHTIGHEFGSSHGETRLIRQAYFEHPNYVPLLRKAYDLWRQLEQKTGRIVFHQNGLIVYGPKNGTIMQGIRRSSAEYGVPITEYDAKRAFAAFPEYEPAPGHEALFEPGAGYLEVEAAVTAQAWMASELGAEIHESEPALAIEPSPGGVRVSTHQGTYDAARVVVTAGAWSGAFLDRIKSQLKVHRVPLVWFEADDRYDVGTGLPCFGFELESGFYYGVPRVSERGVKVGLHRPGQLVTDPAKVDRALTPEDLAPLKDFIKACLPGVKPVHRHHVVCMYTMTPDEHFVLDTNGAVTYAAGTSGHGFKFAPIIGEALADLALEGKTELPIAFLRPRWT